MSLISSSLIELFNNSNPCWDDVYLSNASQIIFFVGAPVAFFSSFFLILGFIRFKELRKPPGDLIIGISCSDFTLSIHWFIIASFRFDISDNTFCTINGFFSTIAGINEFLYNCSFCLYLIISMKNAMTQSHIPRRTFHFFNLTFSVCYTIGLLCLNLIGRTAFGTCSIRSSCHTGFFNYMGPILVFIYVILGAYTYYYIRRNASAASTTSGKRTEFLLYYMRYIIACFIIFLTIAITNFYSVNILNSGGNNEEANVENIASTNALNSIGNAAKLCTPLVLSFIRYNDPFIKNIMKRVVFFWRKYDDNEQLGQAFINDLAAEKKTELTYTLLSCILYAHTAGHNFDESLCLWNKHDSAKHKTEKVYAVNDSQYRSLLPFINKELDNHNINILSGTLKVYAPEVFSEFLEQDREWLSLIDSLDFVKNREEIEKASGGDGGRSGEFFFFSKDKKLIVKTIPRTEKDMMISILERYEQHMANYPNSMIAKIYGVMTYENPDAGLSYNMIIMKNICGFSSKFVERTYDMKGSKHDREVLRRNLGSKSPEDIKVEMKRQVLKDIDFEKLERKLYVPQEIRIPLIQQIEADANFFRNCGLIDYSFMVFFVNKGTYFQEFGKDVKDHTSIGRLSSIKNENEPGIYYNMGIIDYLQPYNFQKKAEKCLKRLKKLDPNLETSSQDPTYYASRFTIWLSSIIS